MGDISHLLNKIHLGDCLEFMRELPDKCVDLVLCDLPYGTTACKWDNIIPFEPLWENYWRVCKPDASIVLTASQPFTSSLVMSQIDSFKYELIWDKKCGKAPGVAKYRPMPSHESILIFSKNKTKYNPQFSIGKPYVDRRTNVKGRNMDDGHKFGYNGVFESISDGRRYPLSVIEIKTVSDARNIHPTQKPVDLFEYLIKTYTNEGDIVLDNCSGSGTTAIASHKTGRRFICIEKDPDYHSASVKRLEEHQKQGKLF